MFNICVIYFSQGQDKEVDAENIFEETIARGTLNLVKKIYIYIYLQIQEA